MSFSLVTDQQFLKYNGSTFELTIDPSQAAIFTEFEDPAIYNSEEGAVGIYHTQSDGYLRNYSLDNTVYSNFLQARNLEFAWKFLPSGKIFSYMFNGSYLTIEDSILKTTNEQFKTLQSVALQFDGRYQLIWKWNGANQNYDGFFIDTFTQNFAGYVNLFDFITIPTGATHIYVSEGKYYEITTQKLVNTAGNQVTEGDIEGSVMTFGTITYGKIWSRVSLTPEPNISPESNIIQTNNSFEFTGSMSFFSTNRYDIYIPFKTIFIKFKLYDYLDNETIFSMPGFSFSRVSGSTFTISDLLIDLELDTEYTVYINNSTVYVNGVKYTITPITLTDIPVTLGNPFYGLIYEFKLYSYDVLYYQNEDAIWGPFDISNTFTFYTVDLSNYYTKLDPPSDTTSNIDISNGFTVYALSNATLDIITDDYYDFEKGSRLTIENNTLSIFNDGNLTFSNEYTDDMYIYLPSKASFLQTSTIQLPTYQLVWVWNGIFTGAFITNQGVSSTANVFSYVTAPQNTVYVYITNGIFYNIITNELVDGNDIPVTTSNIQSDTISFLDSNKLEIAIYALPSFTTEWKWNNNRLVYINQVNIPYSPALPNESYIQLVPDVFYSTKTKTLVDIENKPLFYNTIEGTTSLTCGKFIKYLYGDVNNTYITNSIFFLNSNTQNVYIYNSIKHEIDVRRLVYNYTGSKKTITQDSFVTGDYINLNLDRELSMKTFDYTVTKNCVATFMHMGSKNGFIYEPVNLNDTYSNYRFIISSIASELQNGYYKSNMNDGVITKIFLNTITIDPDSEQVFKGFYNVPPQIININSNTITATLINEGGRYTLRTKTTSNFVQTDLELSIFSTLIPVSAIKVPSLVVNTLKYVPNQLYPEVPNYASNNTQFVIGANYTGETNGLVHVDDLLTSTYGYGMSIATKFDNSYSNVKIKYSGFMKGKRTLTAFSTDKLKIDVNYRTVIDNNINALYHSPVRLLYSSNAIYVSDSGNYVIREIKLDDGQVTTYSGAGTPGLVDGSSIYAKYENPCGLARYGNVMYVSDTQNGTIREITMADGFVNTKITGLESPTSLTIDSNGNIYVTDFIANDIKRITQDGNIISLNNSYTNYALTFIPTSGTLFSVNGEMYNSNSITMTGSFSGLIDLFTNFNKFIPYISLWNGYRFGSISSTTLTLTYDGTNLILQWSGKNALSFEISGLSSIGFDTDTASIQPSFLPIDNTSSIRTFATKQTSFTNTFYFKDFNGPSSAVLVDDNLYITESLSNRIRIMNVVSNAITTLSGVIGENFSIDGDLNTARFSYPSGITYYDNSFYVADTLAHTIRKIDQSNVTTILGTPFVPGTLNYPTDVSVINGTLYICDSNNHCIRTLSNVVSGIQGVYGYANKSTNVFIDNDLYYPVTVEWESKVPILNSYTTLNGMGSFGVGSTISGFSYKNNVYQKNRIFNKPMFGFAKKINFDNIKIQGNGSNVTLNTNFKNEFYTFPNTYVIYANNNTTYNWGAQYLNISNANTILYTIQNTFSNSVQYGPDLLTEVVSLPDRYVKTINQLSNNSVQFYFDTRNVTATYSEVSNITPLIKNTGLVTPLVSNGVTWADNKETKDTFVDYTFNPSIFSYGLVTVNDQYSNSFQLENVYSIQSNVIAFGSNAVLNVTSTITYMTSDSNDNMYIGGFSGVLKYTTNGKFIWSISCPNTLTKKIVVDSLFNVYVLLSLAEEGTCQVVNANGSLGPILTQNNNYYLLKFNSSGVLQWYQLNGTSVSDFAANEQNVCVCTTTYIYKYDTNGNLLSQTYISPAAYINTIGLDVDNNIYICGTKNNFIAYFGTSTLPSTLKITSVTCNSSGRFVAVAEDTDISLYSDDGISWSQSTLPIYGPWYDVTVNKNGIFVATLRGYSLGAYSLNGINWSLFNFSVPPKNTWYTYVTARSTDGRFVAVTRGNYGTPTNFFSYSDNGNTWYPSNLPVSQYWSSITSSPTGRFVAVAEYSSTIVYSDNGVSWIAVTLPIYDINLVKCNNNGRFVAVSYAGYDAAYSDDGINWTPIFLPAYSFWWKDITVNPTSNSFILRGSSDNTLYSENGITWESIGITILNDSDSYDSFYGSSMETSPDGKTVLLSWLNNTARYFYTIPKSSTDSMFLIKYTSNFIPLWHNYSGGISSITIKDLMINKDKIYITGSKNPDTIPLYNKLNYVTGYLISTVDTGAYIISYSIDSSIRWYDTIDGVNADSGKRLAFDLDDNVYLAGVTYSGAGASTQGYTVYNTFYIKYNRTGSVIGSNYYNLNLDSVQIAVDSSRLVKLALSNIIVYYAQNYYTTSYPNIVFPTRYDVDDIYRCGGCNIEYQQLYDLRNTRSEIVHKGGYIIKTTNFSSTPEWSVGLGSSNIDTYNAIDYEGTNVYAVGRVSNVTYFVTQSDGSKFNFINLSRFNSSIVTKFNSNGIVQWSYIHHIEKGIPTWNQTTLPVSSNLVSVTSNPSGRFVAVALSSSVAIYSDNGIAWTQTSLPSTQNWISVTSRSTDGRFSAIASNTNVAAYSYDGISWYQTSLPSSQPWKAVSSTPSGRFISVSNGSNVAAYSNDGITWVQTSIPTGNWYAVTSRTIDGRCVAVPLGSSNAAYSNDGVTWIQTSLPVSRNWKDVTSNPSGRFSAVALSTNVAAYSNDGITWVQSLMPASVDWQTINARQGDGLFFALSSSNNAAYSNNGINWVSFTAPSTNFQAATARSTDGRFVSVSNSSNSFYTTEVNTANEAIDVRCRNSNIYVLGRYSNTSYILNMNTSGNVLWTSNIANCATISEFDVSTSGNVFISGTGTIFNSNGTVANITTRQSLIKYNPSGNFLWRSGFVNGSISSVLCPDTINVYISGNTSAFSQVLTSTDTIYSNIASPRGYIAKITDNTYTFFSDINLQSMRYAYLSQRNVSPNLVLESTNNRYVCISGWLTTTTNFASYSIDGINWVSSTLSSSRTWINITKRPNNGRFVAIAYGSSIVSYSNDGINWIESNLPINTAWYGLASNISGWCVATDVSGFGYTLYSQDGITWFQGGGISVGNWYTVATRPSDGRFVSLSAALGIYSTNGINWTQVNLPVNSTWYALAGSGLTGSGRSSGRFSAAGYGTNIAIYSNNGGVSWTQKTMPSVQNWYSMTSRVTDGRFCVISYNSNVTAYSDDGINWIQTSLPFSGFWTSIKADNNGRFFAVETSGIVVNSDDGINWFSESAPNSVKLVKNDNTNWTQLSLPSVQTWIWSTASPTTGRFVIISQNSSVAAYSNNGINWAQTVLPGSRDWRQISVNPSGRFVTVVNSTNVAAYSNDGITWVQTILPSSQFWRYTTSRITDGRFVAITGHDLFISNVAAYSNDGISWVQTSLPFSGKWVAVSSNPSGRFISVASESNVAAYSNDGITWVQTILPSSQFWYATSSRSIDNRFVAIGGDTNIAAYSNDGISWVQTSLPSFYRWFSVASNPTGRFVAVPLFTNVAAYSDDGITWTLITLPIVLSGTNSRISCRQTDGRFIIHNSSTTNIIYSDDGLQWFIFNETPKFSLNTTSNLNINNINYSPSNYLGSFNKFISVKDPISSSYISNGYVYTSNAGSVTKYYSSNLTIVSVPYLTKINANSVISSARVYLPSNTNVYSVQFSIYTGVYSTDYYTYRVTRSGNPTLSNNFPNFIRYEFKTPQPERIAYYTYIRAGKNGRVIAVAPGNKIIVTTDGINWSSAYVPITFSNWQAITSRSTDGRFVMVSYDENTAAYSDDGLEWTITTLPSVQNWISVAANPSGRFVAVAQGADVAAYSDDGITWTEVSLPLYKGWTYIEASHVTGLFVVVEWDTDVILYSNDGINWSQTTTPVGTMITVTCRKSDGRFVIMSDYSLAAYSNNGINWTEITNIPVDINWLSVTCRETDGRFVAISNQYAAYSDDGINWTQTYMPYFNNWNSVSYTSNGVFVAVSWNSSTTAYSYDGITWYSSQIYTSSNISDIVLYGNCGSFEILNDTSYTVDSVSNVTVIRNINGYTPTKTIKFTSESNINNITVYRDYEYISMSDTSYKGNVNIFSDGPYNYFYDLSLDTTEVISGQDYNFSTVNVYSSGTSTVFPYVKLKNSNATIQNFGLYRITIDSNDWSNTIFTMTDINSVTEPVPGNTMVFNKTSAGTLSSRVLQVPNSNTVVISGYSTSGTGNTLGRLYNGNTLKAYTITVNDGNFSDANLRSFIGVANSTGQYTYSNISGYFVVPETGNYIANAVYTRYTSEVPEDSMNVMVYCNTYVEKLTATPINILYYNSIFPYENVDVELKHQNGNVYMLSNCVFTTDGITKVENFYRTTTVDAKYKTIRT